MSLLLLLAAALFGISRLNQALDTYQTSVAQSFEHERMASSMLNDFKVQVQEWKNVLLRGKDAEQLKRYWAAFEKEEAAIQTQAAQLLKGLPAGDARERVQQFAQAHQRMGTDYRKGLEAFHSAGQDPQAGDQAVKGMDREPAKLLDQAGELIQKAAAATADKAAERARNATVMSLAVMLIVCAAGIIAAVLFSRTVTQPLDRAVQVSQAVAGGDLTVATASQGKDEIALLLNALYAMQGSLSQVVHNVRQNADMVASASTQIAQGSHDLSARTEQQASGDFRQLEGDLDKAGVTPRPVPFTRGQVEAQGGEAPAAPLLFLKPNTAVIGPGDAIVRPSQSERTDFEGELAIVIGRGGRDIPRERWADHVFGYACLLDMVVRGRECEADLAGDLHGLVLWKTANATQQ